ncbi:protein-tyrosine phosphatase family protein [Streptomyces sp. RFCAC02]|uniref:protein-tyrosine phosphatase family protein n=1 Tax=Streptomyces sp. RFCAC02 TaxID=2499143 RepID=UPI001020D30F|nr:protein-tyrosine phosphatase family protein [Streptomyces sp. RFCAC02]
MSADTTADGGATPRTVGLPGGGTVLARGLRAARIPDPPPQFGLYLLGHPLDRPGLYGRRLVGLRPWTPPWPHERIDWPDFSAPRRPEEAMARLREALARVERGERVEVACGGGRGRTGTALAALAVLRGTPPAEAIAWVRTVYAAKAVETRSQRRFLDRVAASSIPA